MHPLAPNLSSMSMDELTQKQADLSKRLIQCQRTGNSNLINQLLLLLEDYRNEISIRQQKMYEDATKNANFKNIIDIN